MHRLVRDLEVHGVVKADAGIPSRLVEEWYQHRNKTRHHAMGVSWRVMPDYVEVDGRAPGMVADHRRRRAAGRLAEADVEHALRSEYRVQIVTPSFFGGKNLLQNRVQTVDRDPDPGDIDLAGDFPRDLQCLDAGTCARRLIDGSER